MSCSNYENRSSGRGRSIVNPVRSGLLILMTAVLTGCSTVTIEQYRGASPRLVLEDYFAGKTYAWGLFEDRFGKVRRQFLVDIDGRLEGDTLILDERFVYDDGERDRRVWRIQRTAEGEYSGEADDVVGRARGVSAGNALNWRYELDLPVGDSSWRVHFNDWMWLQPGDVMINRAEVSKWGFNIGRVTLFFSKQAPADMSQVPEPQRIGGRAMAAAG